MKDKKIEFFESTETFCGPGHQYINIYKETQRRRIITNLTEIFRDWDMNNAEYCDIGCGDGSGTTIFIGLLSGFFKNIGKYGIELNNNGIRDSSDKGIKIIAKNIEYDSIPKETFDIVTCFEVIEHIYDTDSAIDHIVDSIKKGGLLLISTPNTISWKNRILMLLGISPINLEISLKNHYGLKYSFIKDHYSKFHPAGHIRGFTPQSLKEMLEENNMKVLSTYGIENWKITKPFIQHFPGMSTNFLIIARKNK